MSALPAGMCTHVCSAPESQKRASHFPKLELQLVLSCHVGSRKWVIWKSSQCSYLLNPLCSLFFFLNQLIYLRAEETLKAV